MITLVTAATDEPVSLADAKKHLNYDDTADDVYIRGLIAAARAHAEMFTRLKFINATYDWSMPAWPTFPMRLTEWPLAPLSSVTSIKYVDGDGTTQTWAASNYVVQTGLKPGVIELAFNVTLPTTRSQPNAVTVRYVAGYGDIDDVPADARLAMLMLLGHWYENREAVVIGTITAEVPKAVDALLWGIRVGEV
ncbi:hypothetical protein LCGC14_0714600 [marine sediment metagenome]|uniref:Phage gp6-like head-tail connector protein n=1 Tax=marine sediment metagenome TaxID=412755 RepID=A0A0F9SZP4_9ZZZZ|nr:hypothetical protein [Phycisphaerae bacterium]